MTEYTNTERTAGPPIALTSTTRANVRDGGSGTGSQEWMLARLTGLEPATPGVTGRYSNQLSYNRIAAGLEAG